jgi:7,8-dihydropterin-6-yl-methyl-4-(beta-D-ribofuranosyl)aminobenzene 5'-phosphate synthase
MAKPIPGTGGLAAFLAENADVTVYLPASFPQALKDAVLASGAEVVAVSGPTAVCAGASVTGELGTQPKEIGLLVEGPEGLLVITGCAHPGIVDMVTEAKALTDSPVDLVLGGFHLGNESAARIGAIVEALTALGVRRVAPGHCSGEPAIRLFEQAFGEDFIRIGVGRRVSVGPEARPTATPKPRR